MRARADGLVCLALLALAFTYYAAYARFGAPTQDEGWLLDALARVLRGEVPHRDFRSMYPAAHFYAYALPLRLAGESLLVLRLSFALLRAGVVVATFALGRRFLPRSLALLAAATVLVIPGPWHKAIYALVLLAGLGLVARACERGGRRAFCLAGAFAGACFWLRQDCASVLAAALVVARAAPLLLPRGGTRAALRELATDVLASGAAAIGAFAAGLAPLWLAGALVPALEQTILGALDEGAPGGGGLGMLLALRVPYLQPAAGRVVALCCWLALLVPLGLAGAALRRIRRGDASVRARACLALAVAAALSWNQILRPDYIVRLLQGGPLVYLTWCALWGLALERVARRRARALVGLGAALPLSSLVAWVLASDASRGLPVQYTGSVAVVREPAVDFELRGSTFRVPQAFAAQLSALVRFVADHSAPDAPIFVVDHPAILYHASARRNPTAIIRLAEADVERLGAERVQAELFESGARLIVVGAKPGRDIQLREAGQQLRRQLAARCTLVGRVGAHLVYAPRARDG